MNDREQAFQGSTRFTNRPQADAACNDGACNVERLWGNLLQRVKHDAEEKEASQNDARSER